MKAFRETEKAVELAVVIEFTNSEKEITRRVWIPKSQIKDDRIPGWLAGKKAAEFSFGSNSYCYHFVDAEGNTVKYDEETEKRIRKTTKEIQGLLRIA